MSKKSILSVIKQFTRMGYDDPEPNTGPSKRISKLFRRNTASTSKDFDERPFCINRSFPPRPRVSRECDESDEDERLRRLRQPKREENMPRCGTPRVIQVSLKEKLEENFLCDIKKG